MKSFACVFLLAAAVVAEPPRYRFARLRVQSEGLSEGAEEGAKAHGEEAPYAAAGFKPLEEFKLPSRHEIRPSFKTPENSYSAPFKTYTAPHAEYGVPEKREDEERSGGESKEENGEKREGKAENYKVLELPSRHEVRPSFRTPENSYDAPFKTFTAPHVEYGVPEKREDEKQSGVESKEENGLKREGGEAENYKVLELPTRHEVRPSFRTPENSYNAPFKTFTAPHVEVEYGVPEKREGKKRSGGKRKEENAEKREGGEAETFKEAKEMKENLEQEPKERTELESAHGAYYVLLPSQLEKFQFQEENDLHNMAFTAQLQYKSEERAPLFVYTAVPQYQSAAYVQLI